MIRKLRRKFLGIAMLSLLGTLAFLVAAIAVGNAILSANRADRAIALLYENGGAFPLPDSAPNPALGFDFQVREETPFETRYFIARLSENQEVLSVDTEHIAALDRQTVIESLNAVLRSGAEKGYVDHYYRFGVFADEGGGSTVIVLDCFLQVQASLNMLRVTLLVALAGALIVFVILLFSSRVAIRPFVENLERQRRFVTDASHELKTPLAILSADLGLLSDGAQESPWLESANAQVARLNRLIHNLVELARTEESVKPAAMETLNLSEIVQANVDAFQPLAEADGKVLASDVAPGVRMRGVQDNLTSTATDQSLSANQGKVLKGLVDGKAASSHTHDDRYYTESEMNTKLNGKANSSHTHNYAGSSSAGGTANSVNGLTFAAQTTDPGAGSALTTNKVLIVYA